MWFENLVGFEEKSPEFVRENIRVEGKNLISKVNGKSYQFGVLELPSLDVLQKQTTLDKYSDRIRVKEVIGDIQELHCEPSNEHALFQAASQFNLLEMIGPSITPEAGVGIYEEDFTQGPACAIACGAGTIYRNYFFPLEGQIGQSSEKQIDCLELIGKAINNDELNLWQMENGYALCDINGLLKINAEIGQLSTNEREALKGKLKVGLQWDTEVTIADFKQIVSQIYCSALPVAYSNIESVYWENFARIILEATYEATLHASLINYERTGNNKVFLTLVGGGAFGNDMDWIIDSLRLAILKFKSTPLDIGVVSYGGSKEAVLEMIKKI